MEEAEVSKDLWKLSGTSEGKEFHIQFLQNALTSAKLAEQVASALKVAVDGKITWKAIHVSTARAKLKVILRVSKACYLHRLKCQGQNHSFYYRKTPRGS